MTAELAKDIGRRPIQLPPHKDSCALEELASRYASCERPLAIDLFCGCGGLSLGLEQAGFEVILGVDIKQDSAASHRANFGGASVVADMSSRHQITKILSSLEGLKISLIAGGPPCQPFSRAGRALRKSLGMHDTDERRDLWREFLRFVRKLSPQAVLIENVPDMALAEDAYILRSLVEQLEQLNYSVYTRLLHSKLHGVPQLRPRLFITAFARPTPFHWPRDRGHASVLRDAISDLPAVEGGTTDYSMPYTAPKSMSALQRLSRWGINSEDAKLVFDHYTRAVRDDDLEAFRMMTSRTRYSDLPEELRRYRSDIFNDKYNRLDWDEPSRTITAHLAKDGYWYIHPSQNRTITVREAARIQTFPDWFRFHGGMSNAFRQIGEAVPPMLAAVLGRSILRAIEADAKSEVHISTQTITQKLVGWYTKKEQKDSPAAPWRRSNDVWKIAVGELALTLLPVKRRELIWPVYAERWPDPKSFLRDTDRDFALEAIGAEEQLEPLQELAGALVKDEFDDFDELARQTSIPKRKLLLCFAFAGLTSARPMTTATRRVASRFAGSDLAKSAVAAELGVARIIGLDRTGRAYAALTEIAENLCRPTAPHCDQCPLEDFCVSAGADSQESLSFDEE